MAGDRRGARRRRRWVVGLGIVLGLAAGLFAVITFVPLGGPGGGLIPGVDLALQATKIEASNSLTSSASLTTSERARVPAERIAVINRADHPVMRAVAQRVAGRLRAVEPVGDVVLIDLGAGDGWPALGGRVQDLYVVLDLPRFESSGLVVTGRTVDATVTATLGQELFDSHHGYFDHLTPPTAEAFASFELEHHSVTTGYESADARHSQLIENISEQIADGVAKKLTEWLAQQGAMGVVPAGLYPAYRPAPADLPLPDDPALAPLIDGSGLMVHHRGVWTLATERPFAVLADLHARLAAAGWALQPATFREDAYDLHFRGSRGGQVYEAWRVRGTGEGGRPAEVVIRYADRMTREQMRPVFEAMLQDEAAPIETLLRFDANMPADLSDRLTERLMARGDLSAEGALRAARYLHRNGQREAAMQRLREAYLAALVAADGDVEKVRRAGRDMLDDGSWQPAEPTAAELAAMGVRTLVPDEPVEAEVALGEAAMFFHRTAAEGRGDQGVLLGVTVSPAEIPQGRYKLTLREHHLPGGGGGASSTTAHDPPTPWRGAVASGYNQASWHAEAEEIGPDRFRIRMRAKVDGR